VPSVDAAAGARVPRFAASPAYLDTANAGVARAALERAGMFDEGFPGYGWEDFELGIRLKRAGVRRVFCPQAVAFHVQPPTQWADVGSLARKEDARARSAAYFYRKVPTLETRLLIQLTPVHRLVYWLLSCGGWLDSTRAAALAGRLKRRGWSSLAFAVLRSGLNQHYLRTLRRELMHHAPAAA
jgi:GT2 family glycosyltransferase